MILDHLKSFQHFLIGTLCLTGSGCLPDDEERQKGSVNAVSICIEKNQRSSELVSKELIKNQCIEKHATFRPIFYSPNSQAYVSFDDDEVLIEVSDFENPFSNFVITSIKFWGGYRDSAGEEITATKWKTGLWVEPKAAAKPVVKITLPSEPESTISAWCNDIEEKKNCKMWNHSEIKGLEIRLK